MDDKLPYFCYTNSNYAGDHSYGLIDFTQPPFIGEMSRDLVGFKWSYITQGQAIQKIVKFEKAMVTKKFHVLILGKDEHEYMNYLEKFLHWTDVDINHLKMGKLHVGEYYLECYIFQSAKPKRYLNTNKTLLELTIVAENGNWLKEENFTFRNDGHNDVNDVYTANGIKYPYDYKYDYSSPFTKKYLPNESYMDTNFEMVFSGVATYPHVIIGGNTYEINYPLQQGERMVINSKTKTAILHKVNGEEINVFRHRNKDHYIFEKIKGGFNTVLFERSTQYDEDRNNLFTVKITLFHERSEPKWSTNIWT